MMLPSPRPFPHRSTIPAHRTLNTVHCFLLTALLASCASRDAAHLPPTLTTSAVASVTPSLSPSATPSPPPTITPSPSPSIAPSPICSPLRNHPLEQLSSLVSWAFLPGPPDHHYGLDLGHWALGSEESSLYDPVQAVMDGRVAGLVFDRPPSGHMVLIETPYEQLPPALIEAIGLPPGFSVYHEYAHLADPPGLAIGQSVACGELLDRVGLTGWTVAPHLHLETRFGPPGFTFEAMAYYTADATPAEMAAYETWFLSGQYQAFDPMLLLSLQQP